MASRIRPAAARLTIGVRTGRASSCVRIAENRSASPEGLHWTPVPAQCVISERPVPDGMPRPDGGRPAAVARCGNAELEKRRQTPLLEVRRRARALTTCQCRSRRLWCLSRSERALAVRTDIPGSGAPCGPCARSIASQRSPCTRRRRRHRAPQKARLATAHSSARSASNKWTIRSPPGTGSHLAGSGSLLCCPPARLEHEARMGLQSTCLAVKGSLRVGRAPAGGWVSSRPSSQNHPRPPSCVEHGADPRRGPPGSAQREPSPAPARANIIAAITSRPSQTAPV